MFKTVVELAQSDTSGMVITDSPVNTPSLDSCAASAAKKPVHLPHKDVGGWVSNSNGSIASPMPVASAGGREHAYVVVIDYSLPVYTAAPQI